MKEKKQGETIRSEKLFAQIGEELREQNPEYIEILDEALKTDGTLMLKVKSGHLKNVTFKPDDEA
jgi:hypothetical protein